MTLPSSLLLNVNRSWLVLGRASRGMGLAVGTVALLAGGAIAAPDTNPLTKQNTTDLPDENVRFSCEVVNGQYTVVYHPESQPDQKYAWATPTELGGGWTPERRCTEISRRLEDYRPDGLQELSTSVENGYDIVCVTTQSNPTCRIVFTVPPGQDAQITRDRVFENLTVADVGQQTDAVVTYTDGNDNILGRIGEALNLDLNLPSGRRSSRSAIDLRPFLDPADGGTGARLNNGMTAPARQLNPNVFR